ncbi:two-component regulator propeller domain-containing protein [Candidatus Albibeggiatoa sp. nov. BB20]|uniref:sensor histidine kinase n=1 Tax=Candidatus Albibeggiatoa sp. nov. BB20 TaxID=3162723 RepID=UPI003365368A
MQKLILYALSLLLFYSQYSGAQNLKFEHFAVAEGLSHSTATCALQDSQGFLWFCTEDGLNKFDGYNFTIYRTNIDDLNSLSSSFVSDVAEDKEGILWMATNTGLNRFDPKTESFTHYFHEPNNPNSISSNDLVNVFIDKRGDLWVSTATAGLNHLNLKTGQFTHYKHEPNNPNSLAGNNFKGTTHIFEDSHGYLWFGTWGQGLNRFDRETNTFKLYTTETHNLVGNSIYSIRETIDKKRLWVATVDGLDLLDDITGNVTNHMNDVTVIDILLEDDNKLIAVCDSSGYAFTVYDLKTGKLEPHNLDQADPYSINGYPMGILKDHQGNIWVPTWGGGVNKLGKPNAFRHYYHTFGSKGNLTNNTIYAFYEGLDGIIWIGSEGGGLCGFDPNAPPNESAFTCYQHNEENPETSLIGDDVYAISGDSKGILWIATWEGFSRFNPKTKSFTNFAHDDNDSNTLAHDHLYSIHVDKKDRVWVGTWEQGLSLYNQETKQFTHYGHDNNVKNSLGNNQVMYINSDHNGFIWIATPSGLNRFDPKTETFTHYTHDKKDKHSISGNNIAAIYEDNQQRLWIGTSGSGLNLFDPKTETFQHFTRKSHQLSGDTINGIMQDKLGRLWLTTNLGLTCFSLEFGSNPELSCYDPKHDQDKVMAVRNYDMGDGLQAGEFFLGAALSSNTGELYVGGPGGFNRFDPELLSTNFNMPAVVFTDFKLFNESVPVYKESLLNQNINYISKITLTHKENIFSIHFSALDFVIPHKNQYAYQLVGFDKDWVYLDSSQRFTTYTNLPAGTYQFRVKASNNDGIWNDEGKQVTIEALSPWWKTWWAYSIYFLVIAWFFIDQQRKLQKSQAYNQKLQEIDKLKEQAVKIAQANEQRLRQFLDAVPLGIAILNIDGSTHYMNPSALNIMGINHHKSHDTSNISETYHFYIAGTARYYPNQSLTSVRALKGESNTLDDVEIHRADGIVVPIESCGTPIFDERQNVKYAIVTFQDIRERKQAEEDRLRLVQEQEAKNVALRYNKEIEAKNIELIHLNQEKNEFLGIAAHDLKNPLAAIRGTAEYIQEEFEVLSQEELLESAQMVETASRKMFDLITNLLDVNAIESGKVNMNLEQTNLLPIVEAVVHDYKTRAEHKNINIHFQPNQVNNLAYVDKGIVQQVLDNLVSNAVKYSPRERNVFIRLYPIQQKVIRFEIRDEGLGLSKEDQDKLFGKFVRLTPRPTGGEHSTGLGLFIVKKLVDAMGGEVWCESELDKGSTFFVEFNQA